MKILFMEKIHKVSVHNVITIHYHDMLNLCPSFQKVDESPSSC